MDDAMLSKISINSYMVIIMIMPRIALDIAQCLLTSYLRT